MYKRQGFLHSGDLGVKDEDGNYRITGRIKDMIIRGGENIYQMCIRDRLHTGNQKRLRFLLPALLWSGLQCSVLSRQEPEFQCIHHRIHLSLIHISLHLQGTAFPDALRPAGWL